MPNAEIAAPHDSAALVEVSVEDRRWHEWGLERLAERAASATLAHLGMEAGGFAVSILGCDDARIATLNAEFRGKPAPTNVLSWPAEDRAPEGPGDMPALPQAGDADDPEELGDIAIAFDTCAREAAEQGKAIEAHVTHLLVHATLHLLGFDHVNEQDAALMERLEVEILAMLGVADPYNVG